MLFSIFFSCDNANKTDNKKNQRGHTLGLRDIVVVTDSAIWNGRKGDILRNVFEQSLHGLPKKERAYNLFYVEKDNDYSFRPTTIYVGDEILKYEVHEFRLASGKIKTTISIDSDVYEDDFITHCINAFEKIRKNELSAIRTKHQNFNNTLATRYIKEAFNIDLYVPVDYTVLWNKHNFFQAKSHLSDMKIKDDDTTVVRDIIKYIMVFDFKLNDNNTIDQQILEYTNLILKQHIPGKKTGQYVKIDLEQPLKEKNGQYSGMWTMNDAIMAGPIIIKARHYLNNIIVSLGMVYDPKGEKIDYIRTFEAIL